MPVAVGPSNFALINLGFDRFPTAVTPGEIRDVILLLPVYVLKFQHDRIRLSTIHARVLQEIFKDQLDIALSYGTLAFSFPCLILLATHCICLGVNDPLTLLTVDLESIFTLCGSVELFLWLLGFAPGAVFHALL
jgi:hypothetical protein